MNPAIIELARLLLEFEIRQQRKERALIEQAAIPNQTQPGQPIKQEKTDNEQYQTITRR